MYKLNDILLTVYGITPGRVEGEGIAVKGIFDMPKRTGDTENIWAEHNLVEPFVSADELFFEGRTILFQGIILGDKTTALAYIDALKTEIDAFTGVVPFESPYGTACVYVVRITPKFYKTFATVLIEFREPEVGAVCGINAPDTIYYSEEYSDTAFKNDCQAGYHGSEVELTAPAGMFQSTVSQAAANLLAINWVLENKQIYANNEGTCIINPPVYYNVELTGTLQKNDCAPGFFGSVVSYTIAEGTFSSLISQEDADDKAQASLDSILTQAYANANGSCSAVPFIVLISDDIGSPGYFHNMVFKVSEGIVPGVTYYLSCYSHIISYVTQVGDTRSSIVSALVSLINNTTQSQWNDHNQAPNPGTLGYPPNAYVQAVTGFLVITLNYSNQFYAWVI